MRASDIEAKAPPACPTCGKDMIHYGGTAGMICCGWKLLYRGGGWFENGRHVEDSRLSSGYRDVTGIEEVVRAR